MRLWLLCVACALCAGTDVDVDFSVAARPGSALSPLAFRDAFVAALPAAVRAHLDDVRATVEDGAPGAFAASVRCAFEWRCAECRDFFAHPGVRVDVVDMVQRLEDQNVTDVRVVVPPPDPEAETHRLVVVEEERWSGAVVLLLALLSLLCLLACLCDAPVARPSRPHYVAASCRAAAARGDPLYVLVPCDSSAHADI